MVAGARERETLRAPDGSPLAPSRTEGSGTCAALLSTMRERISGKAPVVVAASMVAMHALVSCAAGGGGRESGASRVGGDDASSPTEGGALGVDAAPDSADEATKPDAAGPTCGAQGTFCGGHGVTGGDPGTLYTCGAKGAAPASSSKCTSGCQPNATPPDSCVVVDAGAGQPACPGPGLYCGGDSMSGDPNTLYQCVAGGQAPASSQPCANGCQVMPQGTNDVCRSAQSCPGAGDYCGGDGVQGGDPGTLYHCPGAGQAPDRRRAPTGARSNPRARTTSAPRRARAPAPVTTAATTSWEARRTCSTTAPPPARHRL
jgi:hypothetical protein